MSLPMVLGIDAGGTHTRAVLFDASANRNDALEIESVHPLQYGIDACAKRLAKLIQDVMCEHHLQKRKLLVGIGLAGYGKNATIRRQVEAAFHCHLPCAWYLISDVEAAYYGAFHEQEGILLVAGTGSVAYAKTKADFLRCGGFGYHIDDAGSAYWIGKQLLQEYAKQADGRAERTLLYTELMRRYQWVEPYEIIPYIEEHHERKKIASFAAIAYTLAKYGDTAAVLIFEKAAAELAQMVNHLEKQLPAAEVIPLICHGGVFQSGEVITEPLKANISPRIRIQKAKDDAAYGCYWYVKHHCLSIETYHGVSSIIGK